MIWESFEKIMEFSIYTKNLERKISFIIHSSSLLRMKSFYSLRQNRGVFRVQINKFDLLNV